MVREPDNKAPIIEELAAKLLAICTASGVAELRDAYRDFKANPNRKNGNPTFQVLLEYGAKHGVKVVRSAYTKTMQKMNRGTVKVKRRKIPREWVYQAWLRQGKTCHCCGAEIPTFNQNVTGDHVIALKQATEETAAELHTPKNIRALLRHCNSSKNGRTLLSESKRSGRTILEMLREN